MSFKGTESNLNGSEDFKEGTVHKGKAIHKRSWASGGCQQWNPLSPSGLKGKGQESWGHRGGPGQQPVLRKAGVTSRNATQTRQENTSSWESQRFSPQRINSRSLKSKGEGEQRLNNQLNPTILITIIPLTYFLLNLSHFQDVLCPIWFWSSVFENQQPRNMQFKLNVSLMSLLWSLLFRVFT